MGRLNEKGRRPGRKKGGVEKERLNPRNYASWGASISPDHLEQDDVTSKLIRAVAGSFNATHAALKGLYTDVCRLKKHVAALKAQAQPAVLAVAIHSRPVPGRKRGRRPKGVKNRNKHVYVNGHNTH